MYIYGKLPAHGDFVTRNCAKEIILSLEKWLLPGLDACQQRWQHGWPDIYLRSPIWRFALSANTVFEFPCLGIVMASVDKSGRHFPLTLILPLDRDAVLFECFDQAQSWFEAIEARALYTLQTGKTIDELVDILAEVEAPTLYLADSFPNVEALDAPVFNLQTVANSPSSQSGFLLELFLRQHRSNFSLWWTLGSEQHSPHFLFTEGVPTPFLFSTMMAEAWQLPNNTTEEWKEAV